MNFEKVRRFKRLAREQAVNLVSHNSKHNLEKPESSGRAANELQDMPDDRESLIVEPKK